MIHFLLAFDRSASRLLERLDFVGSDFDAAWKLRGELIRKYESRFPDVEVVILSSDSEQTLRQTHGRYFANAA
jgi:hypothetical protein